MKKFSLVCLSIALLLTGCRESSLSVIDSEVPSNDISIVGQSDLVLPAPTTTTTTSTTKTTKSKKKTTTAKTTKVTTTTKDIGHNIVSTMWEYVGNNGNYKYVNFDKDDTGIDDFTYINYDTSSRYTTSACHFQGYGTIVENTKQKLVFQLDDGTTFEVDWLNDSAFMMNGVKYVKVDNKKMNLNNIEEC